MLQYDLTKPTKLHISFRFDWRCQWTLKDREGYRNRMWLAISTTGLEDISMLWFVFGPVLLHISWKTKAKGQPC